MRTGWLVIILCGCWIAAPFAAGKSGEYGTNEEKPPLPAPKLVPDKGEANVDNLKRVTPPAPKQAPAPMTAVQMVPQCADPAADIQVHLLSKTDATHGRIRVTALLKNVGATPWTSTSYTHRLNGILGMKYNEQSYNGQAMAPPHPVTVLGAGQQVIVLEREMNWTAQYNTQYPKFVARTIESGQADYTKTPQEKLNCRADNDRKEIGTAEVNKLFGDVPPPPMPRSAR